MFYVTTQFLRLPKKVKKLKRNHQTQSRNSYTYVPGSMAMVGRLWSMVVHVTTYYVGPTLDRCRLTTVGTVPTTINRHWINISKHTFVALYLFWILFTPKIHVVGKYRFKNWTAITKRCFSVEVSTWISNIFTKWKQCLECLPTCC